MCAPSGARVGSKRLCWATSTNGRLGDAAGGDVGLGRRDLAQRAADVHGAGRRHSGAAHGTGPLSA